MPTPPRNAPTGPDTKPLDQLEIFGTVGQRSYYKRRVRKDVVAVLEDLAKARKALAPADLAELSEEAGEYLKLLHDLLEHVPHLLNATCTRESQWRKLEALLPREDDDPQEPLPLPLPA